ncbi:GYDIA family GHMP kinase [Psychroserpens sp. S379A]|uniref:GYDIA family GHMP kinase n=1 Tax=Psychroserpens sp. S379A TaxID=3415137 RepID=UPI003C7AB516
MKRFYSHGKLLLTGEYVVLDGALSLAIPTRFGQDLKVEENSSEELHWTSFDENQHVWFEDTFKIQNNKVLKQVQNDDTISNRLLEILNVAIDLNPKFLNKNKGYNITTQLEFPKNWGLGTSSTLVNNIANWANVNPYELLNLSFGGSGYDIACAESQEPLTYQIKNNEILNQVQDNQKRDIETVSFNPTFKDHLYFVHLNQKQNSRDGIAQYKANKSDLKHDIEAINNITQNMIDCKSLVDFQNLINRHEDIISKIISQKPIKEELFKDFDGSVKSLGAWGGDFVLVASKHNPTDYFKSKGYLTIIEYNQMILN